ncbi:MULTISPECIES: hypothetical protein [Pseudanabaena]|uniref:Uncharacterized protein n=2 Tax=Pseudanabaena TaxID=1152 RepID=L8N2G8_9CYAN|nr:MULTISPECIES: hypothetical protein [Pseudanabaena]ELS33886.1 hypothetical protein Pse7429DRAFT_1110 [Pseudanabaena biceps PCC 7429]MDG3493912.1 hypothetical protein [Pseudanabaena catenata USMAC16]
MAFDPISLIFCFILGGLTGASVAAFWEQIKAWAVKVIAKILDAINTAIEVTSDAIVYLVKEGKRIYKRVEVGVRNIYSGRTSLQFKEKEISSYDIPDEMNDQLNRKTKLKIGTCST